MANAMFYKQKVMIVNPFQLIIYANAWNEQNSAKHISPQCFPRLYVRQSIVSVASFYNYKCPLVLNFIIGTYTAKFIEYDTIRDAISTCARKPT